MNTDENIKTAQAKPDGYIWMPRSRRTTAKICFFLSVSSLKK